MKPRILAVEDDPVAAKLLKLLCDRFGYDVLVVASAAAATDALKTDADFTVVLMDWQMKVESGLDCTKRIRQIEEVRGGHIPIIAVTAHALPGARESCLEAGMDDYLSKPYSLEDFHQMLIRWAGPGDGAGNGTSAG